MEVKTLFHHRKSFFPFKLNFLQSFKIYFDIDYKDEGFPDPCGPPTKVERVGVVGKVCTIDISFSPHVSMGRVREGRGGKCPTPCCQTTSTPGTERVA